MEAAILSNDGWSLGGSGLLLCLPSLFDRINSYATRFNTNAKIVIQHRLRHHTDEIHLVFRGLLRRDSLVESWRSASKITVQRHESNPSRSGCCRRWVRDRFPTALGRDDRWCYFDRTPDVDNMDQFQRTRKDTVRSHAFRDIA